ncbi:nitrile hydratase subunit alpha [Streptomyces olivochromogenes]|uniref:nitrile hydratase subunit alpha n=1 Tax=Streptomyces olivochromogenes TaxID=1963 RepID=UPI0036AB0293
MLGLPPSWYKDPAYRARVVKEPRTSSASSSPISDSTAPDHRPRLHQRSAGWCCPSGRPGPSI